MASKKAKSGGKDVVVYLRLDRALLKLVDDLATKDRRRRQDMLKMIIERGLATS